MKYHVRLDSAALSDLKALRAYDRRAVLDMMERVLTTNPTQLSRSRIKRLRDIDSPQYRLRVGEFRVFYDVIDDEVRVLRVLPKATVAAYLKEVGYEIQDSDGGTTGNGHSEGRP